MHPLPDLFIGWSTFGAQSLPWIIDQKVRLAAKYSYTEDGAFTKALDMPTYEWMPVDGPPKAIVLGVHGLTLHGRRFRILARSLAVNGIGFVSLDMRGFGRCHFDDKKQFSTAEDDKTKVNHEKSYQDIVKLAELIKAKYPNLRLLALGGVWDVPFAFGSLANIRGL